MNLSMKWLNEFVNLKDINAKEFSESMTMSGSKVEKFEIIGNNIDKIVVSKILSIEDHPNAKKLFVCRVDIGNDQTIQIVTNAKNINLGDLVPVALNNSILSDKTIIKKGKLRGVLSEGMFCSFKEIGINKEHFDNVSEDGVLILNKNLVVGQNIIEALGLNDTIVEFEITPNRPDCLSIVGLAREAAITFNKPLNFSNPIVKFGEGKSFDYINIDVQSSDMCEFYSARVVKNVKIKRSPKWIRERLISAGIRPINNIIDITNYVLIEYGQPMHVFDLKMIKNGNIIVRKAKNSELVTTLDGIEHKLNNNDLVIVDDEKVLAVAGVMGSKFSGVTSDTVDVVFESASFNSNSVRLTSNSMNIRTDSSSKFEKGLDPHNCILALDRACELINILGCGEVLDKIVFKDNIKKEKILIEFNPSWINNFLNTNISEEYMKDILEKLGFCFENNNILVPTYRKDISHKADIAEEIARFYGYNKIKSSKCEGAIEGKYSEKQKFEQNISNSMVSLGLNEIMTYSFISPKYYDNILMPKDHHLRNSVVISNPLGEDTSLMRTTAVPSILKVLSRNYNSRNENVYLFEIATEYIPTKENKLPVEIKKLVAGLYGENVDFFTVKGIVEDLFEKLDINNYEIETNNSEFYLHPGRGAKITINNKEIGILGEIHPEILEKYEINQRAYIISLGINEMFENKNKNKKYIPISKHPAIIRDLALICDKDLPVGTIEKNIKNAEKELIEKITLFDIYTGTQIENNKKSVAFNIVFRDKNNTLSEEYLSGKIKNIVNSLEKINVCVRT